MANDGVSYQIQKGGYLSIRIELDDKQMETIADPAKFQKALELLVHFTVSAWEPDVFHAAVDEALDPLGAE